MSGKAIKVRGADFSAKGLGQVTLLSNVPIEGMAMTATKIEANKYQLAITYTPSDTYQRDVTWEITAGGYAASISEDGILEIGLGALNTTVTVIATSEYDESITATYSGTFSYEDPMPITYTDNLLINASGVQSQNTAYYTSDFVPIEPGSTIVISNLSNSGFVVFYGEDKETYIGSRKTAQTTTLGAQVYYFRVCNKKGATPTKIEYENGDVLYYHPKAILYGRYVIDAGDVFTSVTHTTGTNDNKQIWWRSADCATGGYFSRRGTRTVTVNQGRFLVMTDIAGLEGDVFTMNGVDYDTWTYNTTIY